MTQGTLSNDPRDDDAGGARVPAREAPGEALRTSGAAMDLMEAFAELGRISLGDTSVTDVMRQVAALAQASIPGADQVSVTLIEDGRPSTVAFTGDLAVHLDERQYEEGFGPCMDAARQGDTIPMLDLEHEGRYPGFVAAARRAGVTASMSVGMPVPSRVVGGLNIYHLGSSAGGDLDEDSVRAAEAFAGYAAVALANAALLRSAQRYADQMREAMASRAVIEQAKGVLVARERCTPEEAFGLLVTASRRQNRKLAVLAAEVLAQAQQSERGPPEGPTTVHPTTG